VVQGQNCTYYYYYYSYHHHHHHHNHYTEQNRALLQKLPVRRLVKLSTRYSTRMFITVFTRARQLSLHRASWTQHRAFGPIRAFVLSGQIEARAGFNCFI
jgi:hypothetical protein